jgi:hypothetical protein
LARPPGMHFADISCFGAACMRNIRLYFFL